MIKPPYDWEKELTPMQRKSSHDRIMNRIKNQEYKTEFREKYKAFRIAAAIVPLVVVLMGLPFLIDHVDKHFLTTQEATHTEVHPTDPPIEKVELFSMVDYGKLYNNLVDLTLDSEIAIEGEVIETTYFEHSPGEGLRPVVNTKSKVMVTESFNKNAKKGDVLTFIESGGIGTKKLLGSVNANAPSGVPKEHENDKVEIIYFGVPAMKQFETVVLFGSLSKFKYTGINEPFYHIIGGFMGKFKVSNGTAERFVPYKKPERMPGFDMMRMRVDDLERKIKKLSDEKSRGEL